MLVPLRPKQREHLTEIAAQRGMTNEALVQQIISRYLEENKTSLSEPAADDCGGLGTEISALFSKHGLDAPIPELRGFTIQNPFESAPKKAARVRPAGSQRRGSSGKASRIRRKKRS